MFERTEVNWPRLAVTPRHHIGDAETSRTNLIEHIERELQQTREAEMNRIIEPIHPMHQQNIDKREMFTSP